MKEQKQEERTEHMDIFSQESLPLKKRHLNPQDSDCETEVAEAISDTQSICSRTQSEHPQTSKEFKNEQTIQKSKSIWTPDPSKFACQKGSSGS